MIYAVECGGRIKLGYSKIPRFRFSKIASDSPFPCEFLGQWEGSQEDEAALHERFSSHRCYREWFSASAEIRACISAHAVVPETMGTRFLVKETDAPLAAWRKAQNLTMEAAAQQVGVSTTCWWKWETKEQRVPFKKLNAVAKLTGLHRRDLCDARWSHLFDGYVEARAA